MKRLTTAIKKIIPAFPLWSNQLRISKGKINTGAIKIVTRSSTTVTVVYFPSCISRVMGGSQDHQKNITDTFLSIASKAGITILIPEHIQSNCCGQIFSSKGYAEAYAYTCNEIIGKLWKITGNGNFPVVMDASSCTYTLQHCRPILNTVNRERFDKLKIIDSIDFVHDFVLPHIKNNNQKGCIVLHPVCSLSKMGLEGKFIKIARHFAKEVETPVQAGCCGMAGDRGFLFPELTASATALEAKEVKQKEYEGYYSSAKTCEMAMSDAAGKNYHSILYLVDEALK